MEGSKVVQLHRLHGGAVKASPGGTFKLVKSWSGDAKDAGLGALVGVGGGYFFGQGVKTTTNLVRHPLVRHSRCLLADGAHVL